MNGVWDTFEARLGRLIFAVAWVALGVESLVYGIPVMRLEGWGKDWPGAMTVGYISGVVVLLAGIGLMWAERAKLSASILAVLTLLWTVGLHLTRLLPTIFHPDNWEGFAQCFAVFAASWVLVSIMPPRLITNMWDRILDTNLKGAFFAGQAAARLMQEGGAILNICSLTSERGIPTAVPYGSSKSGLLGMPRALAAEWAPHNIRVNALAPGYVKTEMAPVDRPEFRRHWIEDAPMRRYALPAEIAPSVVYLASDATSFMTGTVLVVDGGYTVH